MAVYTNTPQSFIIATLPYTTLLPPILLTFVLRPLTFGTINYLPSGPTSILFALLANYYAAIPYTYRYRISPSSPSQTTPSSTTHQATSIWTHSLTITSKATSYLAPLQLALSQFPGSLIAAALGWAVGTAYRRDLLPGGVSGWRVAAWMVGDEEKGEGGFEGLRQRLESERGDGAREGILAGETGTAVGAGAGVRQRRTLGEMMGEQFRGRG
jgi:hypothetical protein